MLDDFEKDTIIDTLASLGAEVVEVNANNGWDVATHETWYGEDIHRIPSKLALIHAEVSEALEAYRNNDRPMFDEEMADILIRLLDLSHGLGIDIGQETLLKLEKNRTRGHRHGGKKV